MSSNNSLEWKIPDWAFAFHGHRCPFMPLGYMAGFYGMQLMGIEKERDHRTYLFSEMGIENPNGCFNDGAQIASGCTYGKGIFRLLGFGKLAIILYKSGKGAVRVKIKDKFLEELFLNGTEFFSLRKQGAEPSEIPEKVTASLLEGWLFKFSPEQIFDHEFIENFRFSPDRKNMNRGKCEKCGEYVYEHDLKVLGGKHLCKVDYYGASTSEVIDISNVH